MQQLGLVVILGLVQITSLQLCKTQSYRIVQRLTQVFTPYRMMQEDVLLQAQQPLL